MLRLRLYPLPKLELVLIPRYFYPFPLLFLLFLPFQAR